MRDTIKKKNPGISVTEVSKKAGQMWKEVKDKTEWEEKAAEEKEKYEIAMKEYKASGGGSVAAAAGGGKSKGAKQATKTASPTKGGSGSNFKSKEYIDEDESSSSGEDSDDKPLKKLKSPKKSKGAKPKKKESEDEEEEEEEESEMSEANESD